MEQLYLQSFFWPFLLILLLVIFIANSVQVYLILLEEGKQRIETWKSFTLSHLACNDEFQNIFMMLNLLAKRANIKTPFLSIIDSSICNAFSVRVHREFSGIAITAGLLKNINKKELECFFAHEIGHICANHSNKHAILNAIYDSTCFFYEKVCAFLIVIGLAVLAAAAINTQLILAAVSFLNINVLLSIVVVIPIFRVIFLIFSRWVCRVQEYKADRTGAQLVDDPHVFISSLRMLDELDSREKKTESGSNWFRCLIKIILNTYPTLSSRIKRIEKFFKI